MRAPAILILLSLVVPVCSQAETIVLKNGRKILVDSVREEKDKYWYEIGDDSYAIPRSSVDHVDSFGSAAASRRRNLIAHGMSRPRCCASHTAPMPPCPS